MPTTEKSPRAFAMDGATAAARSAAKAFWWTANGLAARALTRPTKGENAREFRSTAPPPGRSVLSRAWMEALAKDAADVRAGLYPLTETLAPPGHALNRALDFLKDARDVDQRRRKGDGVEVKSVPKTSSFPNYYRQNFHFQTDGWFSEDSALRYEAQVEALFSGAAGAMRRRALSLLAKDLVEADQRDLTILDAACGAGAFLSDLKATFPRAKVFGADLSEAYLSVARDRSGAPCVQTNLERTPFADQFSTSPTTRPIRNSIWLACSRVWASRKSLQIRRSSPRRGCTGNQSFQVSLRRFEAWAFTNATSRRC